MKKFSVSAPSFSYSQMRYFFLPIFFSVMILSGCAIHSDAEIRRSILESQQQQSEDLAHVRQLSEDNAKQYENLLPLLQDLLENVKGQQRAISQIRNILADYDQKGKESRAFERSHASASSLYAPKKVVAGVETVRLVPPDVVLLARVDTGAETASLDARNIRLFERDGDRWVRFDIPAPDGEKMIPMEQKLSRKTRILQASTDGSEQRLVVELSITFGGVSQVAEFTLTNREHLSFPVLIGRNILRDIMVVDVALPAPPTP